jgi:uncharacterized repeat protein (TIGR01451 family)
MHRVDGRCGIFLGDMMLPVASGANVALTIAKRIGIAALSIVAAATATPAHAEGSRSLYPATYNAAGFRADLDVSDPATLYLNVIKRSAFLYVYAQAGEYITLGSRNRANGGDVLVYNPQSFGQPANETVPAAADFSCATGSVQPGTHYSGGSRGVIGSRAGELAGPNSADNSATVTNGFSPCAYQAPVNGIYGVRFTAATSGGSGASGSVGTPGIGNGTISAWDVTVRADATSLVDLNARLFSYAFVGWTGGNSRPIYTTLYYMSQDGFRYRQVSQGLDPNGFALFANLSGYVDSGNPLYKDVRGNSAAVTTFPTNVSAQPAQYPIFFSDISPTGANATQLAFVLQALGITANPASAVVTASDYAGNVAGNTSTVSAGGDFHFTTENTLTFQIVISRDGVDFDPANPLNRVLNGLAATGTHAAHWDGLDNNGNPFPAGNFPYQLTGRNGELHFPIVDAEGNANGGPTLTVLNGDHAATPALASLVYFDDRGYQTRSGTTIGIRNGFLCGAAQPTPPTPDHSLIGVDSSTANFGGKYYRNWPNSVNSNTDCAATAGFGDAKGLDLWAAQSSPISQDEIVIVAAPVTPDVGTSVTVDNSAFPGETVYGSFVFRNDGQATATGVTYSATIGSPGNHPASVTFTLLPPGVTATYDPVSGIVTFTGMPTSLTANQVLAFNFNYPAPAPGVVPIDTTISAANESPSPGTSSNTATADTTIAISDVATTVTVPPTAAPGSTVSGTVTFSNTAAATADADHVVYTITIGSPGNYPAAVTFPTLPPGVSATYDPLTGVVTLTGMPTTLSPNDLATIGFEYTAPASGTVPVTATISTTTPQSSTTNDSATGSTTIVADDPFACDGTFYQIRQIGATSQLFRLDRSTNPYTAISLYDAGLPANAMGYNALDNHLYALRNPTTASVALVRLGTTGAAGLPATPVSGLPVSGFDGGDFDKQGNYFVSQGGSGPLFRIANVAGSAPSPVAMQVPLAADAAPPAGYTGFASFLIGDFAVRPSESAPARTIIYGVRTGVGGVVYLYRIAVSNPSSATPTAAISRIATDLPNTTFGSVFFDASGAFYAYDNSSNATAGFYTIDVQTGHAFSVSGASSATASDGGSCVFPPQSIDVVKTAGTVTQIDAVTFDVPYSITVGNLGTQPTPNVQVSENLSPTFATGTPTITVSSAPIASAPCTANASFDGVSSFALLSGSNVLNPGVSCTITFTARVAYSSIAAIPSAPQLNTVYASSTTNGPNPGYTFPGGTPVPPIGLLASDTSTNAPTLPPSANGDTPTPTPVQLPVPPRVGITKTVTPTGALTPGAAITYTVTVTNTATSGASGTSVADTLPAGLIGGAWTCVTGSGAAICPNANGAMPIAQTIATFPTGSSIVYTIAATVAANPPAAIANTASASPPNGLCSPGDTAPPCSATASSTVTLAFGNLVVAKTVGGGPTGFSATFPVSVACVVGTDPVTGIQPSDTQTITAGTGSPGTATFTNIPQGATCTVSEGALPPSPFGYSWNTPSITQPPPISGTPASATVANTLTRGTSSLVITKHVVGSAGAVAQVSGTFSFGVDCGADGTFSGSAIVTNGADASTTIANIPANAVCAISETATAPAPVGYTWGLPTIAPNPVTIPATGTTSVTVTNPLEQTPADIAVAKTVDNAAPNVGENVTFTVTATNNGPADATGAKITDGLPAGSTFVSATPSGTTTYASATGIWSIGALAVGASETLQIVATVTEPGLITNTATVSASDQPDPVDSNNTSGASLNANASADIQVTKTVSDAAPLVGANVTYTILAHNNGPDDATGVEITDALPAGVAFVSATTSVGTYDSASGLWTIGDFADGASATLTIVVTVGSPDPVLNTAMVTHSDQFDPAPGNNSSGIIINGRQIDIAVLKVVDNTAPNVGDTVTFTITAHNNGPDDATGVAITDALPAGLTYLSSTPSQGNYDDATGVWTIGNLSAAGSGATAILSIAARVDQPGTMTNTATLTASNEPDSNASNNSAGVSLNGNPLADLVVVKTGPATVNPGGTITYTLTVQNQGPSDAANVVLADTTPSGLTFVGNSGDCTSAYPCTFATIAAGAVVTIDSTYSVPANYAGANPIVNTASATSSTPDPDPSDNSSSVETGVGSGTADLSIVKSGPASIAAGGSITYTLAITNLGPSPANGATYTDALPAGLTAISASCGGERGGAACGAQPSVVGNTVSGSVGALPNGGGVLVTIVATAPVTAGTLTNVATVTPPAGVIDPNNGNNSSEVDTDIVVGATSADLSVVKAGPVSAVAGGQVTYTITVTNNGPDTAVAATLDDPTPAGLAFVSASAPCAGGFPCALGDLAAGASIVVNATFAVAANAVGSIVNTASVGASTPDPDPSDNEDSVTTSIGTGTGSADLRIQKTGPATVNAGGTIVYTLVVSNLGPDAVPDAVVTDPTPTGLVFQSASAPCSGGFPCTIGAIGAGASMTFTAAYTVAPGFGNGQVVNVASVGSPTVPDPTPNDNTSTATVIVTGGTPTNAVAAPVNSSWMLVAMSGLLLLFGTLARRKVSRDRQ